MKSVNSYLNLIKPFRGDSNKEQSVSCFFDNLADLSALAKWPASVIHFILLNKLEGKAASFYEANLKTLRGRPLTDIRMRFERRFATQDDTDPWRAILNCKQSIGEVVEDYACRLYELRETCNGTGSDSLIGMGRLLALFLEGLSPGIREHMVTVCPSSFAEAIEIATRIEKKLFKLSPKQGSAMMAAGTELSEETVEHITQSVSTLAVGQGNRSSFHKGEYHSQQSQQADISGATRKKPAWDNKTSKGKKKQREKQSATDRSTTISTAGCLRDSSGTTLSDLNRVFGGTKHIIKIHLGRESINCLVDPASDYSIISEQSVKSLGLSSKVYKGEASSIAGALGGLIVSESCLDLFFKIDQKGDRYKHSFRIATAQQILGYAAILGMDFLLPNQARIDYVGNVLYLWGKAVTQLTPTSKVQSSSNLLELVSNSHPNVDNNGDSNVNNFQLVQYLPDGSWRTLDEVFEEQNRLAGSSTLACSGGDKSKKQSTANITHFITKNSTRSVNELKFEEDAYLIPIKGGTHAVGEDLDKLIKLFIANRDLFHNVDSKLRILHNFSHSVELTDYNPIKRPQYQIPVALRGDLKDKLQEYLDSDVIEPSTSPWNLPLIVKRKKTGELRLILDATVVNKVTKKIDYPIVRIEDTFHRLSDKQWFSSIDLKNGYHQVQLDPDSRKYYAFKSPYGKHQFKRMPMGVRNSGLFFQRVMEKILAPLDSKNLVIYQDDILVATNTVDEHIRVLDNIFKIFRRENVQINTEKSVFLVREITFLGHTLSRGNFTPCKENVTAIGLLSPPRTKKQLRGVLGKMNFYGRFIPALSQIALPLTNLLSKKKKEITWGPTEEDSFNKLKTALCTTPLLHYPDFTRKFIVSIQVSDSAIVSSLEQDFDDGRWPLAYYSKKLNAQQKNYSIIEKHALAVITVLEFYHHIVHGYEVDVVTDRKAIEYLRCLKDGSTRTTNWINLAAKYSPNYTFNHKKSALTQLLDIASDIRDTQSEEPENTSNSPSILDESPADSMGKEEKCMALPDTFSERKEKGSTNMSTNIPVSSEDKSLGENTENYVIAYTDGSCIKNGTSLATAGIGISWNDNCLPDFSGPCAGVQSNNKAELQAVICAIRQAMEAQAPGIIIYTDSSYIVTNITKNKELWKTRGWLSAKGKPIENVNYFQEIDKLEESIDVKWEHVKGHSGHPGNDRAHELAIKGCEEAEQNRISAESSAPVTPKSQSLAIRANPSPVVLPVSEQEILKLQKEDEECFHIRSEISDNGQEQYTHGIKCYLDGDNIRVRGVIDIGPRQHKRIDCLYVPQDYRERILNYVHLNKWSNHINYTNMCYTLLEKFFWSSFRKDVRRYLGECIECNKMNSARKKPIIMDFPKPKLPGEKIAIDLIGPIITAHSGDKYILTIIDLCSHYLTLCPLPNITTIEVVKALEKYYIAIFGTPSEILTDRGSNFTSKIFQEACHLMRVRHAFTAPYRPATNGMVERANKEIKRKLTLLCFHSGKSWSEKLYLVQFAHNNAWHSSLNTSPNKLVFGHNMSFPGWELHNERQIHDGDNTEFISELRNRLNFVRTLAYEHEATVRCKRNTRANQKRYIPTLKTGDLVMLRSVKKGKSRNHGFYFLYSGPYRIVKPVSKVSFDIQLPDSTPGQTNIIRAHAEHLKPFVPASDICRYDTGLTSSVDIVIEEELTKAEETSTGPTETTFTTETVSPPETPVTETNSITEIKGDGSEIAPVHTVEGYFTRSKGKVDDEQLRKTVIKRGRVIQQ